MADVHFDSAVCDRTALKEDLDKAKNQDALICVFGDWFDAMQGRFDPRRSMDELRPEYRREDYYDFVVKDSARFLEPYKNNILVMARGNHETSVLRHANTDLMDRLIYELNRDIVFEDHIQIGGYGGWIRFMILLFNHRTSVKIKYFHGSGGEAPVTRGVIQTNRQAVFLPDADVVVNGHNHHEYILPITRERISNKGNPFFDLQWHIRIPGYKQSYGDGTSGWDVTRGGVPKPIGSVWLDLYEEGLAIKTLATSLVRPPVPISLSDTNMYNGRTYDDDAEGE